MRKFWQKKYVSKYTGKEIDDAVAKAVTALQNPMTAAGDLIVGGTDGAAGKLAKGTDGKVLKMVSGAPAWADDSQGMVNPMTTAGDMIVAGADGEPGRLAVGTSGQVLKVGASGPEWAADSQGMVNPMTTAGDMIAGSIEGAPYRIPKGTQGQVLTMGASFPEWAAAQGGGGSLYWHTVEFSCVDDSNNSWVSEITILNNTSNAITYNEIKNFFISYPTAAIVIPAGYMNTGSTLYSPALIKKHSGTKVRLYYVDPANNGFSYATCDYTSLSILSDSVSEIEF